MKCFAEASGKNWDNKGTSAIAAWNRRPILHTEAEGMAQMLEMLAGFAEKAPTLDWNEDQNCSWAAVVAAQARALLARIRSAGA